LAQRQLEIVGQVQPLVRWGLLVIDM